MSLSPELRSVVDDISEWLREIRADAIRCPRAPWTEDDCRFARICAQEFLAEYPSGNQYQLYIRAQKMPFLAWWALRKELLIRDSHHIQRAADVMVDPMRVAEREVAATWLRHICAIMKDNDRLFNVT